MTMEHDKVGGTPQDVLLERTRTGDSSTGAVMSSTPFDFSMRAQDELTKRFSAEASIRQYIARDPERALAFPQS
jgi:hypothetical protein